LSSRFFIDQLASNEMSSRPAFIEHSTIGVLEMKEWREINSDNGDRTGSLKTHSRIAFAMSCCNASQAGH
jgi:hypothetical protein